MTFRYEKLPDGNYEVIMEGNTVWTGSNGSRRKERRFAYCTHENDAEVITGALNHAEKIGALRDSPDNNGVYEIWEGKRDQLQAELSQLRAERAGLLDELQEAYNDPQGDIMWRAEIARAMGIIKSKLTQNQTLQEG